MMPGLRSVKGKLHYGWVISGLAFTNLTVEGGVKNSEAVYFVALRDYFTRSAATTAAVFSASGLVGALCAPLIGRLLDRLGPRWIFPIAGLLILAGWLSSSFASDLWQLFLVYSVIAALGHTTISSFTATAILAPWFPQTRGTMLGLADAGNPLGQAIFAPLAQLLVSSIGWRGAFQLFGVVFFLMIAPVNLLFQRRPPLSDSPAPEGAGPVPISGDSPRHPAPSETGREEVAISPPLGQVLRQPAVWFLFLTRTFVAVGSQLTRVHLVAFFILAGYSELQAASAIGLVGLVSIVGRPVVGRASDLFGREPAYYAGLSLQIGAILLVLFLGDGGRLWPIIVFVAMAGLSDGIGGLVVGAKAADLFPSYMLGTVMGLVESGRGLGIAFGPILGGLLFDWQGDYLAAFSVTVGLTILGMAAMWAVSSTGGPSRA
jgi:MFS family permease